MRGSVLCQRLCHHLTPPAPSSMFNGPQAAAEYSTYQPSEVLHNQQAQYIPTLISSLASSVHFSSISSGNSRISSLISNAILLFSISYLDSINISSNPSMSSYNGICTTLIKFFCSGC